MSMWKSHVKTQHIVRSVSMRNTMYICFFPAYMFVTLRENTSNALPLVSHPCFPMVIIFFCAETPNSDIEETFTKVPFSSYSPHILVGCYHFSHAFSILLGGLSHVAPTIAASHGQAPSSPVAQLKATESEEISAQLPEEGWRPGKTWRDRPEADQNNSILSGWWFGTFYMFQNIWDNPSHWLIFFRRVQTTNQYIIYR